LGEDEPVDVAVLRGRTRITDDEELTSHHPWLPSLTLTSTPDTVFPRRYALKKEECQRILGRGRFERIRAFVDRQDERRELWSALHGDEPAAKVIVVQGLTDGDKSAFVKWCVGSMALRGRNTAHVDLTGGDYHDVVQFLGAVADELASFPTQRTDNQAAFDDWLAQVDRMQPPGPAQPQPAPAPGKGRYGRRLQPGPETAALNVMSAFSAALRKAARDELIIIALDGLTKIEPGAWSNYVLPGLVEPIMEGQLPVQLILATREGGVEELFGGRPRLVDRVHVLSVGSLPQGQAPALLAQYLLASGRRRAEFETVVKAVGSSAPGAWDSGLIDTIEQLAKQLAWSQE
jgi:hypothetical protein